VNLQIIRDRNVDFLAQKGISFKGKLPFLDASQDAKWKSSKSIAEQLVCTYALTGLAQDADPKKLFKWLESESLSCNLTDAEKGYFKKDRLSESEIVTLSWKQELVATFAWSLGIQPVLPFPNKEAQLSEIFNKIPPQVSVQHFLKNSARIESEAILQQSDLYYLCHWIMRHSDASKYKKVLNLDVVIERRRALEWIIGDVVAIEDVSLDT
jgi:hypothetical protein